MMREMLWLEVRRLIGALPLPACLPLRTALSSFWSHTPSIEWWCVFQFRSHQGQKAIFYTVHLQGTLLPQLWFVGYRL